MKVPFEGPAGAHYFDPNDVRLIGPDYLVDGRGCRKVHICGVDAPILVWDNPRNMNALLQWDVENASATRPHA